MIFVDTNYFLRFLLKDIPEQYEKALQLFEEGATGRVKLFTSVVVFFELYWVFTSYYRKEKSEVAEILARLLQMKFVQFEQEKTLIKTQHLYAQLNIDLEDAYNLVYAKEQKAKNFKTFDRKLSAFYNKL